VTHDDAAGPRSHDPLGLRRVTLVQDEPDACCRVADSTADHRQRERPSCARDYAAPMPYPTAGERPSSALTPRGKVGRHPPAFRPEQTGARAAGVSPKSPRSVLSKVRAHGSPGPDHRANVAKKSGNFMRQDTRAPRCLSSTQPFQTRVKVGAPLPFASRKAMVASRFPAKCKMKRGRSNGPLSHSTLPLAGAGLDR